MSENVKAISTAQIRSAVEGLEHLKDTLIVYNHPITKKMLELHEGNIDNAILAIKIAYGLN